MHTKMNDFFLNYFSSKVDAVEDNSLSDFMAHKLKGVINAINCENFIYHSASETSPNYRGGSWSFRELNNGGLFTFPEGDEVYAATGFYYEAQIDGRILGLAACMKAFSEASFYYNEKGKDDLAETYAALYHNLRDAFYSAVDELTCYEDLEIARNPDITDEQIKQIKEMSEVVYRLLD